MIFMIDGRSTTEDWQGHTGNVCVLPVGSFEQHGSHLPLATDILCAEHFARMLASALPAALLPALPFGTCGEHSGFRGSVSLRPETLMQIIRDITDEVERQQFRVLVLVNGHGGNFALGPVVRDINRTDRPLKLLLVDWWEHITPEIAGDGRDRGPDLHAGEVETSVMQAIHPDLVRPDSFDRPAGPPEDFPLVQRDLNTFGIGHLSPNGVVGYPSLASAEKGQVLIQSVRARLVPYVRDRVRRLTEQPRHAGPGGIALRPMEENDIAAGMHLKNLAGWNQTEDDWQIFLNEPAARSFAAVHDGQVVGTVTALRYAGDEDLGWIGMLLVDPAFRRQGIGRLLLQRAVDHLSSCQVVKLDATPEGQALYETKGFVAESRLRRLTHACLPAVLPGPAAQTDLRPTTPETWPGVAALDLAAFGADRIWLLRALAAGDPDRALCLARGGAGQVEGFCLGRRGANYHQIGPLVAARAEDAVLLARAALHGLSGRAVVLDVPDDAPPTFARWLADLGFIEQRPFVRMVRGGAERAPAPPPDHLFAICGPEFG